MKGRNFLHFNPQRVPWINLERQQCLLRHLPCRYRFSSTKKVLANLCNSTFNLPPLFPWILRENLRLWRTGQLWWRSKTRVLNSQSRVLVWPNRVLRLDIVALEVLIKEILVLNVGSRSWIGWEKYIGILEGAVADCSGHRRLWRPTADSTCPRPETVLAISVHSRENWSEVAKGESEGLWRGLCSQSVL